MDTTYSERLIDYYKNTLEVAKERYTWAMEIKQKKKTLEEINNDVLEKMGFLNLNSFSLDRLQNEIRKNVMNTSDDTQLKRYFHYLIKLNWSLKRVARSGHLYIYSFKKIKGKKELHGTIYFKERHYRTFNELLLHCESLLSTVAYSNIRLFEILKDEFGFKVKSWKEHIISSPEMPSYKDIENLFETSVNTSLESSKPLQVSQQTIKLNWTGHKNQLYSVLKQLKERMLIGNTNDELVDFLHSNVIGFENTSKDTTRAALNKNTTLPKSKRIQLDTEIED